MGDDWRQIARERIAELELAMIRLATYPPRDPAQMKLPYHINTLMRRASEEFKTAFEIGLMEGKDTTALAAAHMLWRFSAADFAATLGAMRLEKDYFRQCGTAFPGGEVREDVAVVIQHMEELAVIQIQFGRDGRKVSRDYLNILEVLTESGLANNDLTLRRLSLRAWGRTQTTAEALEEFQLELAGAMMLGEHERSEVAGWRLFRSGKAFRSGFAVQPLSDAGREPALYGLVYPGHFAASSWCYLTVAKDVIVASQPLDRDCGTSITNAWSRAFIKALCGFLHDHDILKAKNVRLFEHYFDAIASAKDRSATLDAVGLSVDGNVVWSFVAKDGDAVRKSFEEKTCGPMPAFQTFGFIDQMIEQFRSDAETRVREFTRRQPRSMGGPISVDPNLFRRPKGPGRGR